MSKLFYLFLVITLFFSFNMKNEELCGIYLPSENGKEIIYFNNPDSTATVKNKASISCRDFDFIELNYSQINNNPEVFVVLNADGARKIRKFTTKNLYKQCLVVLKNKAIHSTTINDVIVSGSFIISFENEDVEFAKTFVKEFNSKSHVH